MSTVFDTPLSDQEVRALTAMVWGAPASDGWLRSVGLPLIRAYEQLAARGQRPVDPTTTPHPARYMLDVLPGGNAASSLIVTGDLEADMTQLHGVGLPPGADYDAWGKADAKRQDNAAHGVRVPVIVDGRTEEQWCQEACRIGAYDYVEVIEGVKGRWIRTFTGDRSPEKIEQSIRALKAQAERYDRTHGVMAAETQQEKKDA